MSDRPADRDAPAMRIGLVGCVKKKAATARPAQDLYVSPLFRGRRRYVERTCARWYILSARHGLVRPDEILEPYDESLTSKSRAECRAWSAGVLDQLDRLAIEYPATTFEIHAGATYRCFGLIDRLEERGALVDVPTRGMGQGPQLAFYKTQ